ncbi:MAG: hypothetical protein OXQ29_23895 [Rhodospirillaceae bacterium]|nr:hypothetical protein [Rhodospirillaceae bacterium]
MNTRLNASENHALRVLLLLIAAHALIYNLIRELMAIWTPHTHWPLVTAVAVGVGALLGAHWKKEYVFGRLLSRAVTAMRADDSSREGRWHLEIQHEENGEVKTRSSGFKLRLAFLALKVEGEPIYDKVTREVERERWFSDDAEFIEDRGRRILKYFYRVLNRHNQKNIDKLGIVVATESENGLYRGFFQDISLAKNEVLRKGTVVLSPPPVP